MVASSRILDYSSDRSSNLEIDLDKLRRNLDADVQARQRQHSHIVHSQPHIKPKSLKSFHGSIPGFGRTSSSSPSRGSKKSERLGVRAAENLSASYTRGLGVDTNSGGNNYSQDQPPVHASRSRMSTVLTDSMSSLSSVALDQTNLGETDEDHNIQEIISERFDALINEEIENANRKLELAGDEITRNVSENMTSSRVSVYPEVEAARKLYLRGGTATSTQNVQKSRPSLSPDYERRVASPNLTASLSVFPNKNSSITSPVSNGSGNIKPLSTLEPPTISVDKGTPSASNSRASIHPAPEASPNQSIKSYTSISSVLDEAPKRDPYRPPSQLLPQDPHLTRSVNFTFENHQPRVQVQRRSQSVMARAPPPIAIPSQYGRQLRPPRARSPLISGSESISSVDFSRSSMRSVSPIPEHSRSHVGSSVNVHSSSQAINQGRTSPGSIYSVAPDLVGLAHPQIKGSRLNLHDQGPEMVPRVLDLAEPIQHMSINHLPEETNSKAVISALRTLQEKVDRLEVDKQSAKDKISDLEKDLIQTRHLLINEQTRTWTRQQPPEDISSQLNSNLVESPVITANDVQRRKLEDQVKFLESELKNTRQAFDREHRIAEVSQEAQAIAAELVKEAEIKARKAEAMLSIKEQQMRAEMEAVCEELGAEVDAREEDIWQDAYQKAKEKLQAHKHLVIEEGTQMDERDFLDSRVPSAPFIRIDGPGSPLDADIQQKSSAATQASQSHIVGTSQRSSSSLKPVAGATRSRAPSNAALSLNEVNRSRRGTILGDGTGVRISQSRAVIDEKKAISKEEIENQLAYLRNRALNLETQLEQSRGLHQHAVAERDLAREELTRLQERIRKRERKLRRLSQIPPMSPHFRRSRSPSPVRASPRRPTRTERVREWQGERGSPSFTEDEIVAPTEAWIADETASQIVGPDTEDTGAEGDVEELRGLSEDTLRMNDMSRESSFGFLNERDIRQIRDEMGRAKKESSRAPARSRADSQAASSKRSRVPIWKDTTALSSDPRTRDYARTTTRTRSKSEGVRRRSRSPISKDRQDGRGREMPFIVGTNAGKSYSVTANLQQVFSLLKSHNPLLCTVCNKRENMYREDPDFLHKDEHHCDLHSHDEGPEDEERRGNLQSILSYLEDEFRALRSKYNSLVVKYEAEARDSALALAEGKGYPRRSQRLKDIGDELKEVIQDMSVKGEQIDIMKDVVLSSTRHFETYHSRKRATSPTPAARRHRSHSERPQRERSTTRPSTPHRPASRPMEPRERSSTMPVKRPQPRPSTPFSTSRSPTFLSNRPSSPLVTAIPTYPRHRSPLSGGGWTRNGEDPRPFSRIGPKGGYVGVGLTSSTFTPFAVPKAKPVEIDMTDRGRRMSGGRRRSSSHAPSLGDGVSPFERARSISPSRAVASLSLLKSSLKVQEALVEART